MAYDLSLPDRLRAAGLAPELVDGWSTRGRENDGGSRHFNPRGHVNHHTAGGINGVQPSLNICINGRSDLAGPLCNVFLPREESRRVLVVAAGKANHAGVGNWKGLNSNYDVTGVECEHVGTSAEGVSPLRYDNMVRIAAAMAYGRFGADMVCQHLEWATPHGRKNDFTPSGIPDQNAFRNSVAEMIAQITGGTVQPAPPPTQPTNSVLGRGSKGAAVTHVQERLNAHSVNDGRLKVKADGDFGPGTEAAVKTFQSDVNLKADGLVGSITLHALDTEPNHPAPPPPAPSRPTVQQGSKGSDVKYLQSRLGLSQDGDFGPHTKAAVQAFQRRAGLKDDGIVGPRTWAALG